MKIQLAKTNLIFIGLLFCTLLPYNIKITYAHNLESHDNATITEDYTLVIPDNTHIQDQQSLENNITNDNVDNTDHKQDETNNEFSVIEQSTDTNIILEQNSLSENGSTYQYCQMNMLDIFTGKTTQITINKDEPYKLPDGFTIEMHACWKENLEKYNPMNKAFITIYKPDKNESPLFNGWTFSGITSISFPKYNNYYFYLISCHD